MKRLLLLSAATLMLAGLWSEPAQCLDRPYWDPSIIIADGPLPDHPWGGDKGSSGFTTPESSSTRPMLTATTGFAAVDFMLAMFRSTFIKRMSTGRLYRNAETMSPTTGVTTATSGTTATATGNESLSN
ncbi:MAG: hypothetical protein HY851_07960 [candidate division Zixibacteria bacterium]|nr:hypothetical protein [candidate division Zixibacteria bacterium]